MSTGAKIGIVFASLMVVGGAVAFFIIESKPAQTLASTMPQYSTTTTTTNATNGILTDVIKIIPIL